MRKLILIIILITTMSCNENIVSFTTILHKENATKEGVYLDEYVVYISYDSILMLDNKKIKITGKYNSVQGLEKNDTILRMQGRFYKSKHIQNPKIEIINE